MELIVTYVTVMKYVNPILFNRCAESFEENTTCVFPCVFLAVDI